MIVIDEGTVEVALSSDEEEVQVALSSDAAVEIALEDSEVVNVITGGPVIELLDYALATVVRSSVRSRDFAGVLVRNYAVNVGAIGPDGSIAIHGTVSHRALRNHDLANAAWVKTAGIVIGTGIPPPDFVDRGVADANSITFATGAPPGEITQAPIVPATTEIVSSCYFRAPAGTPRSTSPR